MQHTSPATRLGYIVVLLALVLSLAYAYPTGAGNGAAVAAPSANSVEAQASAAPPVINPAGGPVKADAPSKPSRQADIPAVDFNKPLRVIVQLADPPLASYTGGITNLAATSPLRTGAPRLDVDSAPSRAYLSYLAQQQAAFRSELTKAAPSAKVDYTYQVALNGLAVKTTLGQMPAIQKLPGVKAVTVEREYKLNMDASIPLIGLGSGQLGYPGWVDAGLWDVVGGHQNAGTGLKVADVDTGLDFSHACFNPAGYSYPAGFPKYDPGNQTLVNPKVIVARAYFRPDDPPVFSNNAQDDPLEGDGGHGTHTAGTMVCNYGTQTPYSGLRMSGVAPRAYLMVYRVFYASAAGDRSAFDPELLRAVEDVIRDGADVLNNSWGGTSLTTIADDPLVQAYSAAVDAGIAVVFSAGNSGPGSATAGSPGIGPKFITVGASTTNRTFTTTVSVDSVTPTVTIPPTVTNILARSVTQVSVTAPMIDLEVEGYADPLACPVADGGLGSLPAPLVSGKIVVVRRGVCALVDKVSNARDGGAVGVIIRNVPGGATTLPLINPVLPTAHIALAGGENLKAFLAVVKAASATAEGTIHGPAVLAYTDAPDTIADFSSRGPTPELGLKPDLVAPGVNILSSVSYAPGFDFFQGTSMAAPHVTGAAALLRQIHPSWTPVQIASALIGTTARPGSLGSNPSNRGAGRLDLSHANDPGLTFNPPNLSFGLAIAGMTYTRTVTAMDMTGAGGVYTVTAGAAAGPAPLLPATITVPPGGTANFDVVFQPLAAGSAYGDINVTDGTPNHTIHFSYIARILEDLPAADVLLIDDDNSADPTCGAPDVSGYYTRTLTNLGLTYSIWEVTPPNYVIDFTLARRYSKVVYFTGSAGGCSNLSLYQNQMRNYLASGGKMLITGQDIGILDAFLLSNFGLTFNPPLFFGAYVVQDSLFPAGPPVPAVTGDRLFAPYLAGQNYDISTAGDGAGNQDSVDELRAALFSDTDALPILDASPVTSTIALGHVGTRMSSEPTLERMAGKEPWTHLGYRTQYLSFGLEGVNNNTGFNSREELMDRLLSWYDDQVSVSLDQPAYFVSGPNKPITVTATAATSVMTTTTGFQNRVLLYRWDFGDGTAIQETDTPWAAHGYANSGQYNVRVEVIDAFGHHALSATSRLQAGYRLYLPFIISQHTP